jgi:hypothetical protein
MTLAKKMTNMTIGPTHFHMIIQMNCMYRGTGLDNSLKNLQRVSVISSLRLSERERARAREREGGRGRRREREIRESCQIPVDTIDPGDSNKFSKSDEQ